MRVGLNLVTPPVAEPITLPEARRHLNVDSTDDDAVILDLITRARAYVEWRKGIAFMTQTWDQVMDGFPGWTAPIELGRWPLQSVVSVSYTDSSNVTRVWPAGNYTVNAYSNPPRIAPLWANWWPVAVLQPLSSVVVRQQVGFPDAASVPGNLRQVLLMLLADWFANREDVTVDYRVTVVQLPRGVEDILSQFGPPMVA